jgi:FixJ family two-component response regulator
MSLKKNEELSEKDCSVYENYVHAEVCAQIERELNASKAEVERLRKEIAFREQSTK